MKRKKKKQSKLFAIALDAEFAVEHSKRSSILAHTAFLRWRQTTSSRTVSCAVSSLAASGSRVQKRTQARSVAVAARKLHVRRSGRAHARVSRRRCSGSNQGTDRLGDRVDSRKRPVRTPAGFIVSRRQCLMVVRR